MRVFHDADARSLLVNVVGVPPLRNLIMTSVVPPGWTATMPFLCWASRNAALEPQVGSVVSAAGPTASRIAPVIQRPAVFR